MALDLSTVIGLVLGWGSVLISVIIESGGNINGIMMFFQLSAFLLVVGGTLGATMVSYPMPVVANAFNVAKQAFLQKEMKPADIIQLLVGFATKARREGLLGLEDEIANVNDGFLKKGIQLVVDGTDIELVRSILETDLQFLEVRHKLGEGFWGTMGGYAPTIGIIGTVMGLVNALSQLESAAKVAGAIAVAFIATFYGISFANLIFLPISFKLKAKSAEEVLIREVMIEGILSISAGDNPRIVEEKLKAFLSPKEQAVKTEGAEDAAGTAGGGAA
ncbi:MAG: flagellar motor protein [Spirochaetia bacterium]|nr:flagellar motor protein [Spirochaetia bacterium]